MKAPLFFSYLLILSGLVLPAQAQLQVLTSTTTLKSLAEFIGDKHVQVESIVKGPQDPHYISAKPSYMLKARKADLLVFVGLDLEVGWLPNIIKGARNPRVQNQQSGFFDASEFIQALSVPQKKVNRFFGDIHPHGNPHYLLDPLRAVKVSLAMSEKFSELDLSNKREYLKNHQLFKQKIETKMTQWKQRIQQSQVKKIVSYHSTFEYFLERFDLQLLGLIEEKPGIAPSVKQILKLTKKMQQEGGSCILMSSFYDNKRVKKMKESIQVSIQTVPTEVQATQPAEDYFLLIEALVEAIESCGNFMKQK